MSITAPIRPAYTKGQTVTPAAAAASVNIDAASKQVCLTNLGLNVCYVRVSPDGTAATTADMPVLPGSQIVISKGQEDDALSYISAGGTTLHIITGEGW